jgi:hypothetical protein
VSWWRKVFTCTHQVTILFTNGKDFFLNSRWPKMGGGGRARKRSVMAAALSRFLQSTSNSVESYYHLFRLSATERISLIVIVIKLVHFNWLAVLNKIVLECFLYWGISDK